MSEKIDTPKYPNGVYPELSPNPDFHNGLEDRTSETANTQVVNEPKVQSPKDFDLDDIIALIQKYAPGFDPSSVEAGTLISALGLNSDGLLKKQALAGMFDGKYVRIMDAPASTTLTDEQLEQIKEGVFVNGDLLGFHNPVLFPVYTTTISINGGLIAKQNTTNRFEIRLFSIDIQSKVISLNSKESFFIDLSGDLYLNNLFIKLKQFPSYPANTDIGTFICRKGTLEYYIPVAQDGITSGDTIALDSNLGKALIDHLDVEINGFRARYEYTSGNYVVYSSKAEADGGLKLQVNMISYNTTNGELSFNQMTFTPDN